MGAHFDFKTQPAVDVPEGIYLADWLADKAVDFIRRHLSALSRLFGVGCGTWRTTPVGTIQAGDWKLFEFFEDGRLELYDLGNDPGESRNLAREQPDRARKMHVRLRAWREEIGASMPTPRAPGQ